MNASDVKGGMTVRHKRTDGRYVVERMVLVKSAVHRFGAGGRWVDGVEYRRLVGDVEQHFVREMEDFLEAFEEVEDSDG